MTKAQIVEAIRNEIIRQFDQTGDWWSGLEGEGMPDSLLVDGTLDLAKIAEKIEALK